MKIRTGFSRGLRKNSTDAERLIWKHLRSKQMNSLKFRRQEEIGKYIVDFVCYEKNLIIELDGGQHAHLASKDKVRDAWIASQGFHVLRFWNNEVLTNIDGTLNSIFLACVDHPHPSPLPSREREMDRTKNRDLSSTHPSPLVGEVRRGGAV